ncbi:MAG: SRPBCC domain-containing protein [Ignavibacteria bacterium]|nr:SRPBCC domain-containing protein [Ignavibacteria bacterium]
MSNSNLEVNAAIQIQKPVSEVFEAIVDPEKMCNYFISESTGRMDEGENLIWKFPEFEDQAPVRIGKIEVNKFISFYWIIDGEELITEIKLEAVNDNSTVIRISEKSMENNEAGIKWLKSNTEGWANFLACLKAYLEFGINLRKGGFDFLKKSS